MRAIILAVMVLVTISQVHAVSVATFEQYEDFDLRVGESQDVELILRGDSRDNVEVNFYAESKDEDLNSLVSFNGNPTFSRNYVLDAYEEVIIDLEIVGEEPGNGELIWGFKEPATGTGLNIDTDTNNVFDLRVRGTSNDNNDDDNSNNDDTNSETGDGFDVNVGSNTESTSFGGGGSGGGGSGLLPVDEAPVEAQSGIVPEEEAALQDVTPQQGSFNEVVVDDSAEQRGFSVTQSAQTVKEGGPFLLFVLLLGGIASVVTTAAFLLERKLSND